MCFKNLFYSLIVITLLSCNENEQYHRKLIVNEYLDRAESFGFSGSVHFQKGDTLLLDETKGYRDKELQQNNDEETLFYIASVAKSFTAAAIIKLEDQGKLSALDLIHKFFPNCPKNKRHISVHQLLTHTSGIQSYGWNTNASDWNIMNKAESIDGIFAQNLSNNNAFNYNNANYILLAAIIEKVSKISYQDYINKEFLKPLEMNHTFFGYNSVLKLKERLSKHYVQDKAFDNYLNYPKSWLRVGGGDIISNASDLNKWLRGLYNSEIISKEGKSKLFSIHKEVAPNFGYGYGWYIRVFPEANKKIIFHTGGFKGYASEVRYYPESDISLIVLSNRDFTSNLTEIISNDLLSIAIGDSIRIPKIQTSNKNSEYFSGTYRLDSTSYVKFKKLSNSIVVKLFGQEAMRLSSNIEEHLENMTSLNTRTFDLLASLSKHAENTFVSVLPKEDIKYLDEYVDEWVTFIEDTEFKYTVNHTEYLTDGIYRTYTTIKVNNIEKYFGFTWKNNKLIGTAPNKKFVTPRLQLIQKSDHQFIYYDWESRQSQTWSFNKKSNNSIDLKIMFRAHTMTGIKE